MEDALYKAFLVELEALEKFRITYNGMYTAAPLGREDQDVRRLIEALALFTARTRFAGQRSIARGTMRLFRQHFPYVLSPVPAMAMLRADISPRFVDVTTIPRGTELHLSPIDGREGRLHFRTLAALRLLPIQLAQVDIIRRGMEGWRLILGFETPFARSDEIGTLSLYVNHLNDFFSSLTVHHHLRNHLVHSTVFFDQDVPESGLGTRCSVRFGAPRVEAHELDAFEHPLERARSFLHFPQQELFMDVQVPRPAAPWRRFALALDLDARWPAQLRLSRDAFAIHVAPMMNIQRAMANPVEDDGTKERLPIHHPDSGAGHRLHSVLGVFRLDRAGLVPIRPGVLDARGESYEIEYEGLGDGRRGWLHLELARAFEQPVRASVDAFWHQPAPSQDPAVAHRASLAERHVEGARWDVMGAVVPGRDNRLTNEQDGLLRLLAIKNQRFLALEDLVFVLEALGAREEAFFRDVLQAFAALELRSKPFAKATHGFKYIYHLTLADQDATVLPVIDVFMKKILEILRAWSTEDVVDLEVAIPSLDLVRSYKEELG